MVLPWYNLLDFQGPSQFYGHGPWLFYCKLTLSPHCYMISPFSHYNVVVLFKITIQIRTIGKNHASVSWTNGARCV